MVREIVHVQVGQCRMSAEDKLAKDSNFAGNKDDAENARRFDKIDALRFVSRATVVDLEAGSLDEVKVYHQLEQCLNLTILCLVLIIGQKKLNHVIV